MKKSLVALAALAAAGAASAQSSVTLFGIVDAAVSYYQATSKYQTTFLNPIPPLGTANSIKQSQWALSTSGYNSSRLGFRGTEDLGGGLAASFWLEAGLNNDTGAAGGTVNQGGNTLSGFFNRRSTVSLSGNFGELRLGRDYVPTFWNDTVFDPFGTVGVGASAINVLLGGSASTGTVGNLINNNTYVRSSNSVGYFLPPNLGGFYGQVMYAFGENVKYDPGTATPIAPNTQRAGRYVGGRFGYANGPLDVAASYGSTITGDNYYAGVTQNMNTGNIGASYDFGPAKLFGEYSHVQLKNDWKSQPLVLPTPNATVNGYLLGVTVPVGPGLIRAAYSHVQANIKNGSQLALNPNVSDPKGDKFSLGYVHNLSKRTALYATFAYTKNKNGMSLVPGGSTGYSNLTPLANLQNGGAGYRADTAYGYDFGIRHAF